MVNKVCLITGASSGIGAATAKALLQRGWIVYGAARRQGRLAELVNLGLRPLYLDVTDPSSCAACVGKVIEEAGRIDALVNNAGYGSYG
ncbi:MAG: SDR family NAD(P)-dependent oxidoreductase, partial [Candidatus Bruticola sp.]